ncbi:MAG: N-acyl homoserine lactonase QqlR [Solirubrobacteraceae bacterium]
MSAFVDPSEARLPLPGGAAGASVTVEPLLCGEIAVPPIFFDRPRGRLATLRGLLARRGRWDWVPVPAFLVNHPRAGKILVDTGFHPSIASEPAANLGALAARLYRIRFERDQAAPIQLGDPDAVQVVILTHLHFDHASAISEFPAATFIVDRSEWAAAAAGGVRQGYHARQFDHAFDWQAVDFEAPAVDSFASFGRALDLFGDGSVRLLSTPGHTRGHMSVLLRLGAGREMLLCGDAIATERSLREDLRPLIVEDLHRYRRSRAEIRQFAAQSPSTTIVPGHDAHAWARLDDRYA